MPRPTAVAICLWQGVLASWQMCSNLCILLCSPLLEGCTCCSISHQPWLLTCCRRYFYNNAACQVAGEGAAGDFQPISGTICIGCSTAAEFPQANARGFEYLQAATYHRPPNLGPLFSFAQSRSFFPYLSFATFEFGCLFVSPQ